MNDLLNTSASDIKADIAKRRRERHLNDIRHIVATPEGRRLYWKQMEDCGIFQTSFTGEVNSTMFNEGRRSVGLKMLFDLMDAKPSAFEQMKRENDSELKREQDRQEEEIKKDDILTMNA
jgi:hypothetical protein